MDQKQSKPSPDSSTMGLPSNSLDKGVTTVAPVARETSVDHGQTRAASPVPPSSPNSETSSVTSLQKVISTRQFILMALSSSIGAGLLISTSQALGVGGPGSLFSAFALVGFAVWITMCNLGELSTTFPVKGSFYDYSVRFISPAWGFSMGWNYVINFIFIVPFEVIVIAMCARFWNNDISAAVLVPVFLSSLLLIYVFGANKFAEAENAFGVLKVKVLAIFVVTAIVIASHGVPTDPRPASELGFDIWKQEAFKNGPFGFLFVFMSAGMAYGGTEMLGLTAAECKRPQKVMSIASKVVAGRIVALYLLPIFMLGLTLRVTLDKDSQSKMVSPFVDAVARARIPVLPDIMNAAIIVAIFSMANASVFASSRALRAISEKGMGPRFCAKIKWGQPIGALAVVFVVSLLAFIKVWKKGDDIFTWLLALAADSNYFTWMSICLCQIRCRLAMRKQGISQDVLGYKSPLGIAGSILAILIFVLGLVAQIAASVRSPLPEAPPVFASMLGIVVVIVFWLGYMVFKGEWTLLVPLHEIDLTIKVEEEEPRPKESV